jgi:hypothetical protein
MPVTDTQQRMCGSYRWGKLPQLARGLTLAVVLQPRDFGRYLAYYFDYFGRKLFFWYKVYGDVSPQILNNLCSQNALHTRTLLEILSNRLLDIAVKNGDGRFDGLHFIYEIWESLWILITPEGRNGCQVASPIFICVPLYCLCRVKH